MYQFFVIILNRSTISFAFEVLILTVEHKTGSLTRFRQHLNASSPSDFPDTALCVFRKYLSDAQRILVKTLQEVTLTNPTSHTDKDQAIKRSVKFTPVTSILIISGCCCSDACGAFMDADHTEKMRTECNRVKENILGQFIQ